MQTKLVGIQADIQISKELELIRKATKRKAIQDMRKNNLGAILLDLTKLCIRRKTTKFENTKSNYQQTMNDNNPIKIQMMNEKKYLKTQSDDNQSTTSKMSFTLKRLQKLKTKKTENDIEDVC